jgi:hypothetical protein
MVRRPLSVLWGACSDQQEGPYPGRGVQRLQQRAGAHQDHRQELHRPGAFLLSDTDPPAISYDGADGCAVAGQVDALPFRQWFEQHYGQEVGKKKRGGKKAEAAEATEVRLSSFPGPLNPRLHVLTHFPPSHRGITGGEEVFARAAQDRQAQGLARPGRGGAVRRRPALRQDQLPTGAERAGRWVSAQFSKSNAWFGCKARGGC